MGSNEQHVFVILPGTGALGAALTRSLSQGRGVLVAAGYFGSRGALHIDETIGARPASGLRGFFPLARARSRAFQARLGGPVGRLVVPVLPYDRYFPTLWRAQAQRRTVEDFGAIAASLSHEPRGWPELVQDLVDELAPREVVILPEPDSATALAALAPGVSLCPRPAMQHDLPDTALAMLQRLYRAGITPDPKQLMRLAAYHARLPQPAPLAAFDPLEIGLLRRRYLRDLERMAGQKRLRIGAAPQVLAAE